MDRLDTLRQTGLLLTLLVLAHQTPETSTRRLSNADWRSRLLDTLLVDSQGLTSEGLVRVRTRSELGVLSAHALSPFHGRTGLRLY